MSMKQVQIFDTTLRDGQQCPGAGMSFNENLQYAELAAKVGVDVLEAGFPSASDTDFHIVHTICEKMKEYAKGPVVAALCQLRYEQIEKTLAALEPLAKLQRARLHVYVPVDPNLMEASLGSYAKDKQRIINDVAAFVAEAAKHMQVELSPEGYSRMGDNFDFVTDVIRAAVAAGASVINCPDTIGGACVRQGKDYFVVKMQQHADIIASEFPDKQVVWSAHCHNDFGLALENTMNAVIDGPVRQIEGCFNGIGERAGNVALEQCIIYLREFTDFTTNISYEYIQTISDFVNKHMLARQAHWPVSGDNAAKHTSGGHTNAILKNPLVYQPFDPRPLGKEITFSFGPLSGGNLAKSVIERYGYTCGDDEKAEIAQFIKNYYADRRKGITDDELIKAYLVYRSPIIVEEYDYYRQGNQGVLKIHGQFFEHKEGVEVSYQGSDSALAAFHSAICDYYDGISIEDYRSEANHAGINAASITTIVISTAKQNQFVGQCEDQDIHISALKALSNAVNKAYIAEHFQQES